MVSRWVHLSSTVVTVGTLWLIKKVTGIWQKLLPVTFRSSVVWRHLHQEENIRKCVKSIQTRSVQKLSKIYAYSNSYKTQSKSFSWTFPWQIFPTGISRRRQGNGRWQLVARVPHPRHTFSTVCQIRISRTKPSRRPRQSRLFSAPTWKGKCNTVVQIFRWLWYWLCFCIFGRRRTKKFSFWNTKKKWERDTTRK